MTKNNQNLQTARSDLTQLQTELHKSKHKGSPNLLGVEKAIEGYKTILQIMETQSNVEQLAQELRSISLNQENDESVRQFAAKTANQLLAKAKT